MRRREKRALQAAQAMMLSVMSEAGVTRAELARRLGVTPGFVTQILSGRNLTLRTYARVLAACGFVPKFAAEGE